MLTSLDNPISVDFFTGMGRGDIQFGPSIYSYLKENKTAM